MRIVKIALIQMEVVGGQPELNLNQASQLLRQAKDSGAELAVLPELWTSGYDLENAVHHGATLGEGVFRQISELARRFQMYLCGSNLETRNGRYFNTQTVYSPAGELLATYRKAHLIGLLNEPDFLTAGDELVTCDLPCGKAGLAICYDLRFPEMFRSYFLQGASFILLSAEWPLARLEHWRTLICARAIEDQCFVLACNCVGSWRENTFGGHSLVVDCWGQIVAEAEGVEQALVAEIDLERVPGVRETYPILADRRAGLYTLP